MPFIPHSAKDLDVMLDTIGIDSIDDLFDEIPTEIQAQGLDKVPTALPEMHLGKLMNQRASMDDGYVCFMGAGCYEHHIPAAVWDIAMRGEFLTAYTPYQAEASQGTLQLIYEFQSNIANLTGLYAANASLYDGASGVAEAILMAAVAEVNGAIMNHPPLLKAFEDLFRVKIQIAQNQAHRVDLAERVRMVV